MYPYDRPSLSHLHCGLIKPAVQNITVTILSKTIYTTCTPKHAEKMRIFLKWWMPIQNQGTSPPSRWNWTRLAANPQVLKPGALSIQQTRGLFMVIHNCYIGCSPWKNWMNDGEWLIQEVIFVQYASICGFCLSEICHRHNGRIQAIFSNYPPTAVF